MVRISGFSTHNRDKPGEVGWYIEAHHWLGLRVWVLRLSRVGFRVAFLRGEARFRESVPPALGCSQAGSRLGAQSASCIVSPLTLLLSVQACDPGHCQVQRFLREGIQTKRQEDRICRNTRRCCQGVVLKPSKLCAYDKKR